MPITPNSAFTARCVKDRLELVIGAIERHPRFDTSDPRNSHYTLHCLWDFVHRTRHQLTQIDLQKLDRLDDDAADAFAEVIERCCMAHAMITDPSGVMLGSLMGYTTSPVDLGEDLRTAGTLLMPDPLTGQFTEDPKDQKKVVRTDLSSLLAQATMSDSSEGEWEEGADDSEWEDVGPELPPDDPNRCLFLELPREIRDQIYKYLLCVDYTKAPPHGVILHKPARYDWHLETAILRANKQIHEEAREVLGRENKWIVIERATRQLKQTPDEKQDGGDRDMPDPPLWLGRAKSKVSVPGEVMRINFSKPDGAEQEDYPIDYFVLLAEDLRDFFVNLGKFRTGGTFRTKGLACAVTLESPKDSETKAVMNRRESVLLNPLTKLRQLAEVTITGASDVKARNTIQQMKRQDFSAADVLNAIKEIIATVDEYTQIENYGIAVSYCDWMMAILAFFDASNARHMDQNMAGDIPESVFATEDEQMDMCATMFRVSLKRALASLHSDAFEDAFESADSALRLAMMIANMPKYSDFPGATKGVAQRGPMIEWTTKETAARMAEGPNAGRICPEDVARAYWYRAMALGSLEGNGPNEETDRMFAISLTHYVNRVEVTNELCTLDLDLNDRLEEYERRERSGERVWNGLRGKKGKFEHSKKLRDLPSYDRCWQRSLPPPKKSQNEVTDGGMSYLLMGRCPGMRV